MPPNTQRIVVKDTVYWQARGSDPQSRPGSFVRTVQSDEVPYSRPRIKVGQEWLPIETGWLESASLVVIENLAEVRKTIPSPEEVKGAKAKILEIGVADSFVPLFWVPVGESFRFTPAGGRVGSLRMRCLQGVTQVTLTAYPGGQGG